MENIKDKIQKLLNLATSDNEHEAAAALAKATELMNKWNLDRETVLGQKLERKDIKMYFYKWTDENVTLVNILYATVFVYIKLEAKNLIVQPKYVYLEGPEMLRTLDIYSNF